MMAELNNDLATIADDKFFEEVVGSADHPRNRQRKNTDQMDVLYRIFKE